MKCSFNKDEKIKYNNYIKSENINQNLKNFTKLLKKLPSNPVFPPFLYNPQNQKYKKTKRKV